MTEMIPVASSLIKAVGYDSEKEELHVQFHKGDEYVYRGVPQAIAMSFERSPSVGRYFLNNIKGKYEGVKV